jgi:ribosomal protein S8
MGFWCPLCTLLTGLSPVFKSLLTTYFFKNSLLLVYNNLRIIGLFNTRLMVLSTPKGILGGKEARKEQVGGEVLFKVW